MTDHHHKEWHAYIHDFSAGFVFVPFAAFAIYTTLTLAIHPQDLGLGQSLLYIGLIAVALMHHKIDFSCYKGELTSQRIIAIFLGIMAFAILAGMYQHDGGAEYKRGSFKATVQGTGRGAYMMQHKQADQTAAQPTFRATESYTWEPMSR